MKFLICLVALLAVTSETTANDFEKVVDSLLEHLPKDGFSVVNGNGKFLTLKGIAGLEEKYNLDVGVTDIVFGSLRGSKKTPDNPVMGFRRKNNYSLSFWMDMVHPENITAIVLTRELVGKTYDQGYKTLASKSHITANFKQQQRRIFVDLKFNLVPGGKVQVQSLSLDKTSAGWYLPKYITKFESCKIRKEEKCDDLALFIDQNLWPIINVSELEKGLKSVLERIVLPEMETQ